MIIRNKRKALLISLFFLIIRCQVLPGQDTLMLKQELYNGRIWINRFLMVKGDQFLFSRSFLPGVVTVRGKAFPASIRYDINEDEIQTIAGHFGVLQINKELVDSFAILFNNQEFRFLSVRNDTMPKPLTFYNVLYRGKVSLYVLYQKKVDRLSAGSEGAKFYQVNRIFLVKDGIFSQVGNKTELLSLLADQEEILRTYMKKNHLRVRARDPQSFVPVIRYYNSLIR